MEEMQIKLDQARAKFHRAVETNSQEQEDAAWANYMDVFFQVATYNKIHGTQIRPTL
jgi:hypothetical protein